ncbi:(2Fe-2S)-binding protein [Mycobacteroides chelonae]|uniref:aromatic ring-hydroxylating oxygenase subunit alpha n=1 Tax=Mycobacteroides chelonae TaxID=1774 RepID=UPI0008A9FBA1|nr:aromatic ring-hydroxylating dioxygenase subunit alpha [Mycobacteroides chelonae]OHU42950.1 (2Fe-2S)-binding protein [Mycobacteroides chelonae]
MTITDTHEVANPDRHVTVRGLRHATAGTTDMAASELRVPLRYYRDPKLAEIEQSQILRQVPLLIAPSAQLPRPNDYLVRTILGDSLLVTRDENGCSHVFLNYCRHRGAMPACGSGNAKRFVCPYHAWTYRNTGELSVIPGREGFDAIEKSKYGLVELPAQERHGFIWAVMSAGAPIDVDAHLGNLGTELEAMNYSSYGYHVHRDFDSAVSWRCALEAFGEGYHFPYAHGKSVVGMNTCPNVALYDEYGLHHRIGFPYSWITNLNTDPGLSWDPQLNVSYVYWIYPNIILANSPVGVEIIDVLPSADNPMHSSVRHAWMAKVPAATDEDRANYDALYELAHAAFKDEDFAMLPQCGQAVLHAQQDHMVIGRNEMGVQHMIKLFAEKLGIALQ